MLTQAVRVAESAAQADYTLTVADQANIAATVARALDSEAKALAAGRWPSSAKRQAGDLLPEILAERQIFLTGASAKTQAQLDQFYKMLRSQGSGPWTKDQAMRAALGLPHD